MTNNELVVTLKGKNSSDPWLVIHGDTPEYVDQVLDYISANLIAKTYAVNEQFQAGAATAQLVSPNVSGPPAQQAAPAPAAAPWDVEPPAQEWQQPPPQQAPPVQSAPPAQSAPSGLPPGVKIWQGPNPAPGKEQYTVTFFQVPFITDKAQRDAFNDEMKSSVWAKPTDTTTKPWTFAGIKNGNETLVPQIIQKYAAAGAFNG